jgi:hypothetical protein
MALCCALIDPCLKRRVYGGLCLYLCDPIEPFVHIEYSLSSTVPGAIRFLLARYHVLARGNRKQWQ